MSQIGKIDLKDIAQRTILKAWTAMWRGLGPDSDMDMRFDYLLGAVTYAALAIAALAGAWLLVDLLGGAVAETFPTVPSRLFG